MNHATVDTAPEPAPWLALDEAERRAAIAQAHTATADALHPAPFRAPFHVALHAVVETQIATRDPPSTANTLARLQESGLRRHPALHLIMEALSRHMMNPEPTPWEERLAQLDAADWIGRQMRSHFREEDS